MRGNKGEWSELYTLLRLLEYGKLFAADENLNRIKDIYFPILKILRNESKNKSIEYMILENKNVELYLNNEKVKTITPEWLSTYADKLYNGIVNGADRAFEIVDSDIIFNELECERLAAPSSDKTDITVQIHDINTGYEPICGFSIKSELGNPPTLLNASGATNFVYKITGLTDEKIEEINNIDTRNKIMDRMSAIIDNGTIEFFKAKNDIFAGNLMMIDSRMEEIVGCILLKHYMTGESNCEKVIDAIEEENPMRFPRTGFYRYKFKKFLCSVALGMVPSVEWNGLDDANGGYIIVKDDGDVLAYHIYNRDAFESYLLSHTKFERGSTSRHDYAKIYKDEDVFINLNLQIRFI